MSDAYVRLIPTSPEFVPAEDAQRRARELLSIQIPESDLVRARVSATIEFFDQGENFERVLCPSCAAELDPAWWSEVMSAAHVHQFTDLSVVTPCCGVSTSLNDLTYEAPAGFARFVLEARNPNITGLLPPELLARLESTLGCRLRHVWAHY